MAQNFPKFCFACLILKFNSILKEKEVFVIFDLDGVFTDGTFSYDEEGKRHKVFGADDSDGLKMLSKVIGKDNIRVISADHRGFDISDKRISDMGFKLNYVKSGKERRKYIEENYVGKRVFYIGDSLTDLHMTNMKNVFTICFSNSSRFIKKKFDKVIKEESSKRGVASACMYIARKITKKNYTNLIQEYL